MGQYNKAIITAAGESLISRAVAGELKLNITKAKISDYKYPDGTDYKALTDMDGVKQILDYPETKVLDNNMIQTRVLFSNEEIQEAYYIQNIGLYAKDGEEEILFCIVTAKTPDEMPKYHGVASTSYIYNIQNVVQDAAEVNIEVVPSGTATIQDVMERVHTIGGDISETIIETLELIDIKYPVPEGGDSAKVFMGKVRKFITDLKNNLNVIQVNLLASGWEGNSVPYIQTVAVPFATTDFEAMVLSALEDGATEFEQKSYNKAFAIITSGTASFEEGTATFKVYKKPITDIKIGLKGV